MFRICPLSTVLSTNYSEFVQNLGGGAFPDFVQNLGGVGGWEGGWARGVGKGGGQGGWARTLGCYQRRAPESAFEHKEGSSRIPSEALLRVPLAISEGAHQSALEGDFGGFQAVKLTST